MRSTTLSRCSQVHQLIRIRPTIRPLAPLSLPGLSRECRRHLFERKAPTPPAKVVPKVPALTPRTKDAPKEIYKYPATLLVYFAGRRIVYLGTSKLLSTWPFIITLVAYAPHIEDFPILANNVLFGMPVIGPVALTLISTLPMGLMYLAAPYVTHIHIPLPNFARVNKEIMMRYVSKLPKDAKVKLFTMRALARPKMVEVPVGELKWTKKRLGCVNMEWTRMEKGKQQLTDFFVDERRGAKGGNAGAFQELVNFVKRQTVEAEMTKKVVNPAAPVKV